MNVLKLLVLFFVGMLVTGASVKAQVEVKGTVYDISAQNPVRGVSVLAVSGKGTQTDSLGHYHIALSVNDSISFSYLGRETAKTAIKDLPKDYPFDISLHVSVSDTLRA